MKFEPEDRCRLQVPEALRELGTRWECSLRKNHSGQHEAHMSHYVEADESSLRYRWVLDIMIEEDLEVCL